MNEVALVVCTANMFQDTAFKSSSEMMSPVSDLRISNMFDDLSSKTMVNVRCVGFLSILFSCPTVSPLAAKKTLTLLLRFYDLKFEIVPMLFSSFYTLKSLSL